MYFSLSPDNHTVANAKKNEVHNISTSLVWIQLILPRCKERMSFALCVLELKRKVFC